MCLVSFYRHAYFAGRQTALKTHSFLLSALLKEFTSKVDGFTFVQFYLKVITLDVKVGYIQEKSSSEGITF